MFRLYSKGCEYALRGLIQFSRNGDQSPTTVQSVSHRAKIPLSFTRKMFQKLVQKKILTAVPGPQGGYRLRLSPKKIRLLTIINAIDGSDALDTCLMGDNACHLTHPCILHDTWLKAKRHLIPSLKSNSLDHLIVERESRLGLRSIKR